MWRLFRLNGTLEEQGSSGSSVDFMTLALEPIKNLHEPCAIACRRSVVRARVLTSFCCCLPSAYTHTHRRRQRYDLAKNRHSERAPAQPPGDLAAAAGGCSTRLPSKGVTASRAAGEHTDKVGGEGGDGACIAKPADYRTVAQPESGASNWRHTHTHTVFKSEGRKWRGGFGRAKNSTISRPAYAQPSSPPFADGCARVQ